MSTEYQERYLDNTELKPLNEKTITGKRQLKAIFTKVRKQGYCIVDQELEKGLRAIAVPISRDGDVVASVCISSEVNRATLRHFKVDFLPLLRDAAAAISSEANCKT